MNQTRIRGKVERFMTSELGTIDMDTSKSRMIEIVNRKHIEYVETNRTITLKDRNGENLAYFVFSDSLDEIILVDLCCLELEKIVVDNKQFTADFIKENLKWTHKINCLYKNQMIALNDNLDANCSTGIKCGMCSKAGNIQHEANLGYSIISYVDFGEKEDNQMFCLENFQGKHVNFKEID